MYAACIGGLPTGPPHGEDAPAAWLCVGWLATVLLNV